MKTGIEAVVLVVGILDELKIPYMLVGSFSSNFYGVPRATNDADLVVVLSCQDRQVFLSKLPVEFRAEPQVQQRLQRRGQRHCRANRSVRLELSAQMVRALRHARGFRSGVQKGFGCSRLKTRWRY